jgi:predicted HTH transcriptional regulator
MNKTKGIMAAITASLLSAGPTYSPAATAKQPQQEKTLPDDSKKADPAVQENGKKILQWLKTNPFKTVDEVVQQFQELNTEQATKALDQLRFDALVRRSGSGTKDDPYKYYAPVGTNG